MGNDVVVMHPVCKGCEGTGMQGYGKCPDCKDTPGRLALSDGATVEEWISWIREQPTVQHGVEVFRRLLKLPAPPAGLEAERPDLTVPVIDGKDGKKDKKDKKDGSGE